MPDIRTPAILYRFLSSFIQQIQALENTKRITGGTFQHICNYLYWLKRNVWLCMQYVGTFEYFCVFGLVLDFLLSDSKKSINHVLQSGKFLFFYEKYRKEATNIH